VTQHFWGQRRLAGVSALLAIAVLALSVPVAGAGTTDFPAGYEGYHTYAEMAAEIDAAVAAHPGIIRKFSIGRSYEGREIWAVKISDRVSKDEGEPEILFEAASHAREHLSVEMALYAIRLLTDNYAATPGTDLQRRVSSIVNSREIFIVPMVNVDGAEYDIAGGTFRSWRKNRQPIPGSTNIGIDLNRNWGYKWGCCGGSSGTPSRITYRGPEPWFAPEVRALRDFVNGRVIGGRQQIREAISWHTYGEWVLWPYGYTAADLPASMTRDDLAALRAIGLQMADSNGYTAQQLSELYILDGGSSDWLYHQHRIMAYTIEMYPPDPSKLGDFYPPDSTISAQTERNRQAVLYFLEQADCPYRSAGLTHNCGPLYDDFEIARGWTVNPSGADTASRGKWERALGQQTTDPNGPKQLGNASSGEAAFVTARAAGSGPAVNDVDGGVTTLRSPQFRLGTGTWTVSFDYTFAHDAAASADDHLRVSVLYNGTKTPVWSIVGDGANANAAWTSASASLTPWKGKQIRLLVEARDGGPDNILEAALDDVRVFKQ
jgi:hypothetical protein